MLVWSWAESILQVGCLCYQAQLQPKVHKAPNKTGGQTVLVYVITEQEGEQLRAGRDDKATWEGGGGGAVN